MVVGRFFYGWGSRVMEDGNRRFVTEEDHRGSSTSAHDLEILSSKYCS